MIPENSILKQVYPLFKPAHSGHGTNGTEPAEIPEDQKPVANPLVPGLLLFYVVDQGDKFVYLKNEILAQIPFETLHTLALSNLHEYTKKRTQVHGDFNNAIMIVTGGVFEASIILLDHFWKEIAKEFTNQMVVAIPTRDVLMITDSMNEQGLETLRSSVRSIYKSGDTTNSLTGDLYVRNNDKWEIFEKAQA